MLKERMLVQAAGETITAVNAAAGVSKLLQISAGAAYTDGREVVEFDCSPRLSVLMEVLEETKRKVLVFAWGEDGTQWIGRSMTLFNKPDVKFGGVMVGGIRISHLSHIDHQINRREIIMDAANYALLRSKIGLPPA